MRRLRGLPGRRRQLHRHGVGVRDGVRLRRGVAELPREFRRDILVPAPRGALPCQSPLPACRRQAFPREPLSAARSLGQEGQGQGRTPEGLEQELWRQTRWCTAVVVVQRRLHPRAGRLRRRQGPRWQRNAPSHMLHLRLPRPLGTRRHLGQRPSEREVRISWPGSRWRRRRRRCASSPPRSAVSSTSSTSWT